MGLIDDVRKRKDSWTKRYEEQRQDEYNEQDEDEDEQETRRRIEENKKRIGVFEKTGD